MRVFVSFLLLSLFAPFMVFGADSEYYTDEAQQIVNSSRDITDSLRQDYAELEKQILKLDPDYAKKLTSKKLTDEQKLTMARSYLAQKAFDYYKDTFMAELEQHSKETGRKITQHDFGSDITGRNFTEKQSWLDRGKLDSNVCKRDGWLICKYPDGFEEFHVNVREDSQKDKYGKKARSGNNDYLKIITYDKDFYNKNAHQYCKVTLDYRSNNMSDKTDSLLEETLGLDVWCDIVLYNKWYGWLNQEVEDTINGKHDVIGKEIGPDGNVYIVERQSEDFSKWESNSNIPGGYAISKDYNYSRSVSTTYKDAK
ncbi:MAG: hypothetical protein MJ170_03000 [Alphaproteobacteria bacterium]|nr:hypothetical protein [Alphaproteobacteria bacterium]